jgi:hypothetical protein
MSNNNTNNNVTRALHPPRQSSRPTSLDAFANSILFCTVIFWPTNVFLELTGDLCHSTTSKVVFCGLPSLAVFCLWIAMFQTKGCWAISREGRTAEEYKRLVNTRCAAMLLLLLLCVLGLWQASVLLCNDGCGKGVGDGVKCGKDGWGWDY